jgi:hypothetical protein
MCKRHHQNRAESNPATTKEDFEEFISEISNEHFEN